MEPSQKNSLRKNNFPASNQLKKRVAILDSFEQMNESDIQEMIKIRPVDRIRNTVELILRAHGVTREQLLKKGQSTRIEIFRST